MVSLNRGSNGGHFYIWVSGGFVNEKHRKNSVFDEKFKILKIKFLFLLSPIPSDLQSVPRITTKNVAQRVPNQNMWTYNWFEHTRYFIHSLRCVKNRKNRKNLKGGPSWFFRKNRKKNFFLGFPEKTSRMTSY